MAGSCHLGPVSGQFLHPANSLRCWSSPRLKWDTRAKVSFEGSPIKIVQFVFSHAHMIRLPVVLSIRLGLIDRIHEYIESLNNVHIAPFLCCCWLLQLIVSSSEHREATHEAELLEAWCANKRLLPLDPDPDTDPNSPLEMVEGAVTPDAAL